ncbi:MAG TPA: SDR family oxidoreductase [Chthoniobacterales bacterium]|nr:SDR family oxidoreductase [Chthoniobacterales bacterium]
MRLGSKNDMTPPHHPSRPRIIVITGASAGVGRASARAFAREGARLALLARGGDGLEATRREVEALGGQALALSVDVADAERVESAAQEIEARFGPIDVWINNAMLSVFSPVKKMTAEEFKRVTEVTYLGYVHGTLAALRRMLPRDRGLIIQVGSSLAYRGIPQQSAYCAAKHAIQGFVDSLRSELLHDRSRVQVTMIQLPGLNTPQFEWVKSRLPRKAQPVPPIFQPEVAARAIVHASHHPRREVFVGGSTVKAILLNRLMPGVLDHYLARTIYDAQEYDGPADPNRPHNLWAPVPGDHGAHGAFDQRARSWSLQAWLNEHRGWIFGALVLGAGTIASALARNKTVVRR